MARCLANNLWKFHQKILNYSENNDIFVGGCFFNHSLYTEQASMDMDISMDIHAKSVDMDVDMDGKFHIHGNPVKLSVMPDHTR